MGVVVVLSLVLQAIWFVLPAYAANAFPVVVRGRKPLDFGRKLGKYRVLGDGKTFEGTFAGILFGTLVGTLQMYSQPYLGLSIMSVMLAFLLSAGAITGDIIGAFIKRRSGIPRGGAMFPLDQLDFLLVALLFSSFIMMMDISIYVILMILTPIIHILANIIGHRLKLKEVPW